MANERSTGKSPPRGRGVEVEMRTRITGLQQLIEAHVVPKLMRRHDDAAPQPSARSSATSRVSQADAINFSEALVAYDLKRARQQLTRFQDRGISNAELMIGLFAEAARHLGDEWLADRCSFSDVTTGLGGLQLLLGEIPLPQQAAAGEDGHPRRARLLAFPGEQHTFGVLMVAEFLRSAGWHVVATQPRNEADLVKDIAANWYDLVGVSVSAERHLDELPALIGDIRGRSVNGEVKLLGGGNAMVETDADDGETWGFDGLAFDGSDAISTSERLVPQAMPRGRN
ncbi:MAG: cobalamin B12-binding domain-containing protein [Pseudomonadota bacterium]